MTVEYKDATFELKFAEDGKKQGVFSGYGAVFGNVDSYGDVIEKGAFRDTLRAWEEKGKYAPMLLQHGGGMFGGTASDQLPIGKWTSMEENSKGLKVEGFLDPIDTDEGKKIYAGMKNGELDGLSIGFRTIKARNGVKPSDPSRFIESVALVELSVVTFPANDKARATNVKSDFDPREMEAALREAGLSRNDAVKAVAVFRKSIQREAGGPHIDPRDEAEIGKAIASPFAALAKLIHSN
jgi:HK97 family phage prohead protease